MNNNIWTDIKKEVSLRIDAEPALKDYLESLILSKDNIIEATAAILASKLHNDAFHDHEEDEANPGDGKINDWHTRHEDQHLEVYCDNHPDSFECRVYDD